MKMLRKYFRKFWFFLRRRKFCFWIIIWNYFLVGYGVIWFLGFVDGCYRDCLFVNGGGGRGI